jgi:hypothetical protein
VRRRGLVIAAALTVASVTPGCSDGPGSVETVAPSASALASGPVAPSVAPAVDDQVDGSSTDAGSTGEPTIEPSTATSATTAATGGEGARSVALVDHPVGTPLGLSARPGTVTVETTPDDRYLVYSSSSDNSPTGTPVIRIVDTVTGDESVFAENAAAPVVSRRGPIAYARGVTPPTDVLGPRQWTADVVVRPDLTGTDTVWLAATDGGWDQPIAWAGNSLVVERHDATTGWTSTILVTAPNTAVPIDGTVHGVSPDGRSFVTATSDASRYIDRIDASTGESIASVTLAEYVDGFVAADDRGAIDVEHVPSGDEPQLPVTIGVHPGAWYGDDLILHGSSGLLLFDASNDDLRPVALLLDPGRPQGWNEEHREFVELDEPSRSFGVRAVRYHWERPHELTTVSLRCSPVSLSCVEDPAITDLFGAPAPRSR